MGKIDHQTFTDKIEKMVKDNSIKHSTHGIYIPSISAVFAWAIDDSKNFLENFDPTEQDAENAFILMDYVDGMSRLAIASDYINEKAYKEVEDAFGKEDIETLQKAVNHYLDLLHEGSITHERMLELMPYYLDNDLAAFLEAERLEAA